jgi:hypothetical protein
VEVTGGCNGCPCPSIELRVDPSLATAAPHDATEAGHLRLPPQASGPQGDLILFEDGGLLAYLEYTARDPDDPPLIELPAPALLDTYTLPITG